MPHDVRIESYGGPRDSLRPLFELADDSAIELDSYIEAGRVPGGHLGRRGHRPPPADRHR